VRGGGGKCPESVVDSLSNEMSLISSSSLVGLLGGGDGGGVGELGRLGGGKLGLGKDDLLLAPPGDLGDNGEGRDVKDGAGLRTRIQRIDDGESDPDLGGVGKCSGPSF